MGDMERLYDRVMRKLFPDTSLRSEIESIMDTYGRADWQPEGPRVKLAILKLSSGKPAQIRYFTVQACRDYREILAAAETPGQLANPYARKNDPGLYARLEEEDRKQYEEWIREVLREKES
ncbi:MAG: hypothetical protein JXR72_08400 [Proteobacteria bacterium]|nr:hypothetical protein [Pseudomonadota bacterium]